MPELPTYTATGQTRGGPLFAETPAEALTAPARALTGLGLTMEQVGSDVAQIANQRQRETDLRWATEASAQYSRTLAERRAEDAKNPRETEGPEFRDFADEQLAEYSKNAPSQRAKDIFRVHGLSAANAGYERALHSGEQTRLINADLANDKATADIVSTYKTTAQLDNPVGAAQDISRLVNSQLASIDTRFGQTMPALAEKMRKTLVSEVALGTASTNPGYARQLVASAPIEEKFKYTLNNEIDRIERDSHATATFNTVKLIENSIAVGYEKLVPVPTPNPAVLKALPPNQAAELDYKVKVANGTISEFSKIKSWNWQEQQKAISAIDITSDPVAEQVKENLGKMLLKSQQQQTENPFGWQTTYDSEFNKPSPNETPVERSARIQRMVSLQGPAPSGYGFREDGTRKGPGFLGELKRPDGMVSTEISIGVEFDGKETQIPTLVPTLTKAEIDSLLRGDKPSDAIVDKAVAHARKRMAEGKSPFMEDEQARRYLNLPTGLQKASSVQQAEERAALYNNTQPNALTTIIGQFDAEFPDPKVAAMVWNDMQNLPEGKKLKMGLRVAAAINDIGVRNNFLGAMSNKEPLKTDDGRDKFVTEIQGRDIYRRFVSGWKGDGNQRGNELAEFGDSITRYAMTIAVDKKMKTGEAVDTAIKRVITDNYGLMNLNGSDVPIHRYPKGGGYFDDGAIQAMQEGIAESLKSINVNSLATDLYHFPLQPRLPGSQEEANRYLQRTINATGTVVAEPDGTSVTVYIKGEGTNDFPFQLRSADGSPLVWDLDNMMVRGAALRFNTNKANEAAIKQSRAEQNTQRIESEMRQYPKK